MNQTQLITFITDYIEANQEKLDDIAKQIFDFAEVRFEEYKSSALISQVLEDAGFSIRRGVGKLDTAFIAEFSNKANKPVVAFLGEYDALPNLSQIPGLAQQQAEIPDGSGHGCGHNLLGTASLGAALAVKEALLKFDLSGSVRYYGCPAEEGGSGKTFMVRDGVFDYVDTAICWHPAPDNIIWGVSTLANIQAEYAFKGISSHAAAAPEVGRSALDAVELMNVGANYLREHVPSDVRFHYAITDTGGKSPNVVQADAKVLYLIRAPQIATVNDVYARISNIAKGAALMTGTEVTIRFDKACSNYLPNHILASTMDDIFHELGAPAFNAEEIALAKEIRKSIPEVNRQREFVSEMLTAEGKAMELAAKDKDLSDFIYPYGPEAANLILSGSTDVGDVSWKVPTVQCLVASHTRQTAAHTWQWTTTGKTSIGLKGMRHAAKIMGATGLKLFVEPELITAAKAELDNKTQQMPYQNPIPVGVDPNNQK
ncbi:M20 family metallopeptidase [Stenoxybacter acetivorans]|uniref:M20 family metallopeptidase n=1 Tax=Stenoxybacter acetivorans TaxID=422441 RepID=UPI00056D3C16|nr:M20 family metallopeptidase [Stenoxybacter acetivorans]